jgi:hypothetical protein cfetvA_16586
MWVSSKQAAEILGVNNKSVEKAAFRAKNKGKKFCSIKCHICHFTYAVGVGRGGKTLQIWIDDAVINDDPSKKESDDEKNSINANLDHSCGSDSIAFCSAVDSTS